jgi:hypothetical protein
MMLYPKKSRASVNVPPITGAQTTPPSIFVPWQPSTWPPAPPHFDEQFHVTLSRIFDETMVDELHNVVGDILEANGRSPTAITHRGHVIAVAYMCALDAISLYGYKNRNVKKFVREHFPADYRPFANRIYPGYRHNLVHAWNLFGDSALLPGNDPVRDENGTVVFGILNFVDAFDSAVSDFLRKLETDTNLQKRALQRYREVTGDVETNSLFQKAKDWLCSLR